MPIYRAVDKDFFNTWNPRMAYVLGFLFADGTVTTSGRGAKYFALHSMDRSIMIAMRRSMSATQKLSRRNERSGFVYRLQIGSKQMVADLYRAGLRERKASRMKLPSMPADCFPHFVRGYFDGDGNVWSGELHRDRPTKVSALQVSFTSASESFLRDFLAALRKRGIVGGSLYRLKTGACSRLMFGKYDALKLYELMYNGGAFGRLYLKRKKAIFDAFFKNADVAQLVRAPACRRAAFRPKGGLKLSGISVKAKPRHYLTGHANTEGTSRRLSRGRRRD